MSNRVFYWIAINVISTIVATLIVHFILRYLNASKQQTQKL